MPYTVDDLTRVDGQIAELKKLRKQIVKDLTTRERLSLTGDLLALFNFIETNPECDKQTILAAFSDLDPRDYSNLMNKLVRNRAIVANRGIRSAPRWVVRA